MTPAPGLPTGNTSNPALPQSKPSSSNTKAVHRTSSSLLTASRSIPGSNLNLPPPSPLNLSARRSPLFPPLAEEASLWGTRLSPHFSPGFPGLRLTHPCSEQPLQLCQETLSREQIWPCQSLLDGPSGAPVWLQKGPRPGPGRLPLSLTLCPAGGLQAHCASLITVPPASSLLKPLCWARPTKPHSLFWIHWKSHPFHKVLSCSLPPPTGAQHLDRRTGSLP